jgi:putative tryptophan/tyrosine transport system substrate-binding protein
MLDMERREFIGLVGGGGLLLATKVKRARAQQPAMPVVGFLRSTSLADATRLVTAFRQGLKEAGFVEGQNVAIEYRWARDQYDRLPDLAADLVRRQVAVIVAADTPSAIAAKATTAMTPILFVSGGDPVKLGLVASLNRPGGNVTGISFILVDLEAKQLGLLCPVAKAAARTSETNRGDGEFRIGEHGNARGSRPQLTCRSGQVTPWQYLETRDKDLPTG